ncbi:MAG: ParB/RepB/Spo0J family partition protein, partial [Lepagella sp.]
GRGLDSMFPAREIQTEGSTAINEIRVADIQPNPDQPRTIFDQEALEELSASIGELGIIQPLSLRLLPDGTYQIIAGERRWRAARMAGLQTVPAYVRTASDVELTEMALIENIQREDLNAIEVALALRKLIDTYSLTQERLAERLGKKRATIANHLRLLRLPAEIQLGLRDRRIDMGHARALLGVDDPKVQLRLYNMILREGASVRQVEEMARRSREQKAECGGPSAERPKAAARPQADYDAFRRELSAVFPVNVKFARRDDGRGSITLRFDNDDELQQLVALFDKLRR